MADQAAPLGGRRRAAALRRPVQSGLRPRDAARVGAGETQPGSKTAGVDGQTRKHIEAVGVEKVLGELRQSLRDHSYAPLPVREHEIPKRGSGKVRKLGIPALRDRIVQMAAKLVLEPIFEADFCPTSYGFRPGRRAQDAIEQVRFFIHAPRSYEWAIEGDVENCFAAIHHGLLMEQVRRRVTDKRVLALIRKFLGAGIMSQLGTLTDTPSGTPQGAILSPVLANIALSSSRATWRTRSSPLCALCPALSPERVALAAFPSGDPLPSTTSATPPGVLFGGFAGNTRSCITRLRPGPFPHDPPYHHHKRAIVRPPGSRIRRFRACTGSSTPRGPPTARENAADDVAFRTVGQRRHPDKKITRLNSPAYAYPYRRFAAALTDGRRTARGHRGSLALRCWTLSFLSPDRFIPALSLHRKRDTLHDHGRACERLQNAFPDECPSG